MIVFGVLKRTLRFFFTRLSADKLGNKSAGDLHMQRVHGVMPDEAIVGVYTRMDD